MGRGTILTAVYRLLRRQAWRAVAIRQEAQQQQARERRKEQLVRLKRH